MNCDLSGKHALVCGASQGIGAAIALELAALGARITGVARTREKLAGVAEAVKQAGGAMNVYTLDLLDLDRIRSTADTAMAASGPVHVLVLNSGGPKPGPILEATDEAILAGVTAHVLAAQQLVRAVLPGMQDAGYGRIINLISTSVKQPIPNLGASNTIRGAVASWAKTLAGELGPSGITVNNVLPGYTDTGRLRATARAVAEREHIDVDAVLERWARSVPARRVGRPEEVAQAVGFLASPAASYINGINLPVDGGRLQTL